MAPENISTSSPPPQKSIDYSLYLVTGRDLLPEGTDYYEHLRRTLRAGKVRVVQIREKNLDNGEFLDIAARSLEICDRYDVPMLINDNLSVALCLPHRVGLHIGQEDIPPKEARRLLGNDRLLGLSVHNPEQARRAVQEGYADYVGVGPVYGTKSKAGITEEKILGPKGARAVVEALQADEDGSGSGNRLPCVLIGGINLATCARSLAGSTSPRNHPDGVAVISAIVSRPDPDVAAEELSRIIEDYQTRHGAIRMDESRRWSKERVASQLAEFLEWHRSSPNGPPLIQTITSHVSSTLSANIALAFASSPIMSHQAVEASDLARVAGAVVLNIGTISEESRRGMTAVGREANKNGRPVVLDPVGVGASTFRRECVEQILSETQVTLIKGNAAELSAIAGLSEVASRGVDSGAGTLSDPVSLVMTLATRENCLILLTGKTDYLSDGHTVFVCANGHPRASQITGTGCALGVMLAAGMASACTQATVLQSDGDKKSYNRTVALTSLLVKADHQTLLLGAMTALLTMNIASEIAAARPDVRGPGTFIPALIDEIANLDGQTLLQRARFRIMVI